MPVMPTARTVIRTFITPRISPAHLPSMTPGTLEHMKPYCSFIRTYSILNDPLPLSEFLPAVVQ